MIAIAAARTRRTDARTRRRRDRAGAPLPSASSSKTLRPPATAAADRPRTQVAPHDHVRRDRTENDRDRHRSGRENDNPTTETHGCERNTSRARAPSVPAAAHRRPQVCAADTPHTPPALWTPAQSQNPKPAQRSPNATEPAPDYPSTTPTRRTPSASAPPDAPPVEHHPTTAVKLEIQIPQRLSLIESRPSQQRPHACPAAPRSKTASPR